MKFLLPIGFAFSDTYLIELPLYSQITAVNIISWIVNQGSGASFSSFPFAPHLHIFIPWTAGAVLITLAMIFAIKCFRTNLTRNRDVAERIA